MTQEQIPDWLVARVRRDPPDVPGLVVPGSTPVVCFGDQRTATVATLGINPSSLEFATGGQLLAHDARRLETLPSLGATSPAELTDEQVRKVLDGCYEYFHRKPYRWLDHLAPVLEQVGASYRDRTACHLDLVQWATGRAWTAVDPQERQRLLDEDEPFLVRQLTWDRPEVGRFRLVLVNGRSCVDQCRDVGVSWAPLEDLVVNGRTRFWSGEWQGVRILGWTANLPDYRCPTEIRAALPGHVATLLSRLGWDDARMTPADRGTAEKVPAEGGRPSSYRCPERWPRWWTTSPRTGPTSPWTCGTSRSSSGRAGSSTRRSSWPPTASPWLSWPTRRFDCSTGARPGTWASRPRTGADGCTSASRTSRPGRSAGWWCSLR